MISRKSARWIIKVTSRRRIRKGLRGSWISWLGALASNQAIVLNPSVKLTTVLLLQMMETSAFNIMAPFSPINSLIKKPKPKNKNANVNLWKKYAVKLIIMKNEVSKSIRKIGFLQDSRRWCISRWRRSLLKNIKAGWIKKDSWLDRTNN